MGAVKIRLLVVDDIAETRANLSKLLLLEDSIEVVGEAGNGEEALAMARQLKPDIVLMDINMPIMDGIQATEKMTMEFPQIGIIILSVQGEGEYLRKAMTAGARDYLTKPPSMEELIRTINRVFDFEKKRQISFSTGSETVHKPGKIISIFSSKGGVGKSLIAANLAVAINQVCKSRIAIVDLDLQFGDMAMLLDLLPRRTIADLVGEPDHQDIKTIESYLIPHTSGIKVLTAPLRPEYAETVHARDVEAILTALKSYYDFVIIDTCRSFDDITLTALDHSDTILVITTQDVLTIKNVKLGLEVMSSLHYESIKIKLVLNRSASDMGVSANDLASSLKFPITCSIPSDPKIAVLSANKGIPFVLSDPKALITESILNLAKKLTDTPGDDKKDKVTSTGWRSLVGR